MKVRRCTTSNYCTCAIAARASSDIYIIDRCDDDKAKWRFDFMSCVEDILHVVKKKNNEYSYEVCFSNLKNKSVVYTHISNISACSVHTTCTMTMLCFVICIPETIPT